MKEYEIRYWSTDKPIPVGWEWHDGLDRTHHGANGWGMITRKIVYQERCCFCGHPEGRMEQQNGHYEMTCCRQVMEGCCSGETSS